MLVKTITYTDFFDQKRTEDYYFNLTKSELRKWQYETDGGLDKLLTKIIKANDVREIYRIFEEVIRRAYGIPDADGRRFNKSEKISNALLQSAAYDALFEEIFKDEKTAADFFKGILPSDLQNEAALNIVK